MKRWSWLMALMVGVSMLVSVGCEDDDEEDGAPAGGSSTNGTSGGTSGGGTSGGGTSGGGTSGGGGTSAGGTNGGGASGGGTTTLPSQILAAHAGLLWAGQDYSNGGHVAPADGVISLNVSWSSQLDGNGTPAPEEYRLSLSLGGVVNNGNASSPAQLRAAAPAGSSWGFTIANPNPEGGVLLNWSLVWSPD